MEVSDREKAIKMRREAGMSIRAIAAWLKRPPSTVQGWVGENGTQSREEIRAKAEAQKARIREARERDPDLSMRKIADELGCDLTTVWKALQ